MGLFDIFKKKEFGKKSSGEDLEQALKRAASEPAFRFEFYKRLLSSKLVVLTQDNNGLPDGISVAKQDLSINIFSLKDGSIPVFTSNDRIFDKGIIKSQMTVDDMLKMLRDKKVVLNPYSDYGKVLLPDEIERVLDGTIFTGNVDRIKVDKPTSVAIGQPAEYPTEVIKSLIELFKNKSEVSAAYMAWIYDHKTNVPPHYIFAIDAIGDWNRLSQETGFTISQIIGPDSVFDIMKLGKGGINDYFRDKTTPFYKK